MQQPAEIEVLAHAITALAPLRGPRGVAALRLALRALLADDDGEPEPAAQASLRQAPAPARPAARAAPARQPPSHGTAGHAAPDWPSLRRRVVAEAAARNVTRTALAEVVGVSAGSLKNYMAPAGHPPGPAVVCKLIAWLDTPLPTTGASEVPASVSTFRRTANGVATRAEAAAAAGS